MGCSSPLDDGNSVHLAFGTPPRHIGRLFFFLLPPLPSFLFFFFSTPRSFFILMCFFFFPVVRVYAREVLPAPLDDVHIAVGGARNFVYLPNLFETLRPGRSCACTGDARCLVRIFVFFSALSHYLERIFLFFSPSHVFDSTPSSKKKTSR